MDAALTLKAKQLAGEIAAQAQTLDDLNGLMRTRLKAALQRMLATEMDVHRGRKTIPALPAANPPGGPATPRNRRNGRSKKTVRRERGERALDTPPDRQGTFEPQRIGKQQRRLSGFDEKSLALYAKGMTTRDIQDVVKELYGVDGSPTLVSAITADRDAEGTAWRQRRLEAIGPIVSLDGIVVPVRSEAGRVSQHTMYVAIAVNVLGKKELLGLWLRENEGAPFWLGCLTDRKNRGLNDLFLVCVDGLTGFADALGVAYPQAKVQVCIVPWVRAALTYVTDKDSKPVAAAWKKIYPSATVAEAEQQLQRFAEVWDEKYPRIVKQWRLKWNDIITLLDLPPAMRKAIDTTNALESVNSVIGKFTRKRKQYPHAESALKRM